MAEDAPHQQGAAAAQHPACRRGPDATGGGDRHHHRFLRPPSRRHAAGPHHGRAPQQRDAQTPMSRPRHLEGRHARRLSGFRDHLQPKHGHSLPERPRQHGRHYLRRGRGSRLYGPRLHPILRALVAFAAGVPGTRPHARLPDVDRGGGLLQHAARARRDLVALPQPAEHPLAGLPRVPDDLSVGRHVGRDQPPVCQRAGQGIHVPEGLADRKRRSP